MRKIILTVLLVFSFIIGNVVQPTMAAEKDKYGGILKIAYNRSPNVIGYPTGISGSGQDLCGPAMETLVSINRQNVVEPRLATSWKISDDHKSYTFKLRKGVKFHDGTDFNAQAVKYNLDLWLKKPGPELGKMTSVDVIDEYTVRVNFSEFYALAIYEIAVEAYMASPTSIEKNGVKWAETHPVGTGPFKWKSTERNVALKYERNDNYWDKGLPYLDGVEFVAIKDPMTQVSAAKSGIVHGIQQVGFMHAKMLEKEGYVLSQWPGPSHGFQGDSKNPKSPWSNRKVREAVAYAINKESLIKNVGLGYPKALYQLLAPDNPFYNPDLRPMKYDPEKAKKLLAEAGYPNGFKTKLFYLIDTMKDVWFGIQADLKSVGIDAEPAGLDRAKYLDIRYGGNPENSCSSNLYYGEIDVIYALQNYLSSKAEHNPTMARPAGFDELLQKIFSEPDSKELDALIKEAARMLHDDVTFIPLWVEPRLFVGKGVNDLNYGVYKLPGAAVFKNAWLSKK